MKKKTKVWLKNSNYQYVASLCRNANRLQQQQQQQQQKQQKKTKQTHKPISK